MSPCVVDFRGDLAANFPEGPDSEHMQIIRHVHPAGLPGVFQTVNM